MSRALHVMALCTFVLFTVAVAGCGNDGPPSTGASGSSLSPAPPTASTAPDAGSGTLSDGNQPSATCTPTTCQAQGKDCGKISNGCGALIDCGTCAQGMTCGGNVPNVCGSTTSCTPTTCVAEGKDCGTISDGCGGTLDCGTCAAGEACGTQTPNVCSAAVTPPPTTQPACQAGAWASFAQVFFTTNCTGCHSQFGSYSSVKADASNIQSKLSSGQMPPSGGLSSTAKSEILTWLGCGAPQ